MPIPRDTPVVFDVNVYLDYFLGEDGTWPLIPSVPPSSGNPAADAVALAFDARFRLFTSPHVLRNVIRVVRAAGNSRDVGDDFAAAIAEMCEFSGGGVVEPAVRDHGIADFEDNAIVGLAKDPAVDALIVVTRDADFLASGQVLPGRLLMHPRDFTMRAF